MAAATRTATFPRFPLPQLASVSASFSSPLVSTPSRSRRKPDELCDCTVILHGVHLGHGRRLAPARSGRRDAALGFVYSLAFAIGIGKWCCLFLFPFSLLLAQLANAMCDPRDDAGVLYDDEAVVVVVRAHLNVVLASRRPHADMDIVVAQFEARDQLVIGVRRNTPKTCAARAWCLSVV